MVNMKKETNEYPEGIKSYRDLYAYLRKIRTPEMDKLMKQDQLDALDELRHKAYVEGYGEFKKLNKLYFKMLAKQNEKN